MTVLGKILAIANLVFSLAVAAFIVMAFAARTNWHDAYMQIDAEFKKAVANANAAQAETDQVRQKLTKSEDDLKVVNNAAAVAKGGAEAQIGQLKTAQGIDRV